MKNKILQFISLILSLTILVSSCSSTTLISSIPSDSKLYINGELVGKTPFKYRDSKIVGSSNTVRIESKGYETYNTTFSKDEEVNVGAMIGGFFFLIPFLWIMKYKKSRLYELNPIKD